MRFDRRQPRRRPRHENRGRRRGRRAANHQERVRRRERQRLCEQERTRQRARRPATPSPLLRRTRNIALFTLSLGMGLLLATPLQRQLASLAVGELAELETIAIQGNRQLSFEEVAAATGVEPGSPLASVDSDSVEQSLLAHAWLQEAQVLRVPPATLLVRVKERTPTAVLRTSSDEEGGQGWRLVDESGTPFAQAGQEHLAALPHLCGGDGLASGRPHPVLVTALELAQRLHGSGARALAQLAGPMEIHLPATDSPEGWRLRSHERSLEVVLGRAHLVRRLERLAQLLAAELPEVRENVRIDLRFADQAVLRTMSASG